MLDKMLAVLSLTPIGLVFLSPVICHFMCAKCRERAKQARVDAQIAVGQWLAREKRNAAEAARRSATAILIFKRDTHAR